MSDRNSNPRSDTIVPTFRGIYLERFLNLIEAIDSFDAKRQRAAVCEELGWCGELSHEGTDRLKYQAMLMVLSDLMGQGWRTQFRQRRIFVIRPDYTDGKHLKLDHGLVKEQIRSAFREERLARINTPSTIRFIRAMEDPPKGRQSVLELITRGSVWAAELRQLPDNATEADLAKVVSPYLQLARAEVRDTHSGLKLIDIWRYFRYHWAIPYQPTPGRNLFYLVRDSSRRNHPIIGIAALGNCVVQLSERDKIIGWSVEAVEFAFVRRHRVVTRDLPKGSPARKSSEIQYMETEREHAKRIRSYASTLARTMDASLTHELSVINQDGLATAKECGNPTESLVRRLLATASDSERERREQLSDSHMKGESTKRTEGDSSVEEDTNSPLFVRKRAKALADILFARLVFQRENLADSPHVALPRMLKSDDGRKALRIGLHSNKKTKIGSSMMDIIVCGAIPPYAEMLGGKLVAMLMASPQVVRDYSELYGGQPGEIASRLAGKDVVRDADLVYLTTTSLFHVGSSQYERIKIPGPKGSTVSFEQIGKTEGFGSTVLSTETTDYLRALTIRSEGMRRINNIFGEGISPKMRMTRDGLALIGMPQNLVLRHNCPRLIYGVRVAKNAYDYLCGVDAEPKYVFSPNRSEAGTKAIVRHWLTRWFSARARRPESLTKVECISPDDVRISHEISPIVGDSHTEEKVHARLG